MANLDQVVDILISRSTQAVSRAGFGVPLVIAPKAASNMNGTEVRQYSDLAGMLSDGFLVADAAYKMVQALFNQNPRPQFALVKAESSPVAQVNTLTPDVTLQAIQQFNVTINGTLFSFTSDASPTAAEVVTGLIALINANTPLPVTASGTTTLILTADTAGLGFSVVPTSNMVNVATTPNAGVSEDINAAISANPNFYGVLISDRSQAAILLAAAATESLKRLLFVSTAEANVKNGVAANTLKQLKALAYDRTVYLYSDTSPSFPDSAWMGSTFPLDPGQVNFAFRTLAGQIVDTLSPTQQTNIQGDNGNTFENIGGIGVTSPGKVVSGEWIDTIRNIDWLTARLQEDVFSLLINTDIVPFTDAGGALLESVIRKRLENAVTVGVLASYSLFIPKVADIQMADKLARFFTGITFDGVLQGAINKVKIRGRVSV